MKYIITALITASLLTASYAFARATNVVVPAQQFTIQTDKNASVGIYRMVDPDNKNVCYLTEGPYSSYNISCVSR